MKKDQYLNEIISAIVSGFTNTCYFRFGYWPEVRSILQDLAQDTTLEATRYPFIMLSAGWTENREPEEGVYADITDATLYIVAQSDKNYSTTERETLVFQAVIEPIYNELLTALKANEYIEVEYDRLPHSIQKLYYLRNMETNQNQLRNYVEVMQLNISNIRILDEYTCQ